MIKFGGRIKTNHTQMFKFGRGGRNKTNNVSMIKFGGRIKTNYAQKGDGRGRKKQN